MSIEKQAHINNNNSGMLDVIFQQESNFNNKSYYLSGPAATIASAWIRLSERTVDKKIIQFFESIDTRLAITGKDEADLCAQSICGPDIWAETSHSREYTLERELEPGEEFKIACIFFAYKADFVSHYGTLTREMCAGKYVQLQ